MFNIDEKWNSALTKFALKFRCIINFKVEHVEYERANQIIWEHIKTIIIIIMKYDFSMIKKIKVLDFTRIEAFGMYLTNLLLVDLEYATSITYFFLKNDIV